MLGQIMAINISICFSVYSFKVFFFSFLQKQKCEWNHVVKFPDGLLSLKFFIYHMKADYDYSTMVEE